MSEACVKQCYGFATLYSGRGGILNAFFKIPIIFCHLKCFETLVVQVLEKILTKLFWFLFITVLAYTWSSNTKLHGLCKGKFRKVLFHFKNFYQ